MNPKQTFNYVAAMALAYGIVLALPVACDFLFDTHLELLTIAWCNTGLIVMLVKRLPYPVPDGSHLDIRGGLKTLWWAMFWPTYLLRK
jgi:hypothetical protein